ncbi:MAG: type IV pilus secretin PilQ [Ostreibacterium sp.]
MYRKASLLNNKLKYCVLLISLVLCSTYAADIQKVSFGKNPNGAYEIQIKGMDFSGVSSYSLNNPARIVVDIPNGKSQLAQSIIKMNNSLVSNVAVIEGDDRARATISLVKSVPYTIIKKSNKITIAIKSLTKGSLNNKKSRKMNNKSVQASVDFKRGSSGQGKIQIQLPNDNASIDVERSGSEVIAKLRGGKFGQSKKLNVSDFGTPVKSIDVFRNRLKINVSTDNFEIVSFQSDNIFSIEFNKASDAKQDQALLQPGDSRREYSGEPLSLNFQDIDVRAVLHLIGDLTNTNIVVSGEVSGSITLRLNNVPWDQALDVILQTKGLSMQKNGSVIFIAPSNVIAKNTEDRFRIDEIKTKSSPLEQQLIQVQYARAENLKKLIDEDNSNNTKDRGYIGLLTSRGYISVDTRTNTLIVNDVPSSIDKIQRLIASLDVPVSQVSIDARIVSATDNFAHELGIRWGGGVSFSAGSTTGAIAGSSASAAQLGGGTSSNLGNRLGIVDLATTEDPAGSLGINILGSKFLLDLELSALQNDGRGEVISSPRVITQDGTKATITSGKEIAYTTRNDSGSATVAYKKALLSLDVTPKIAPNQMIDMILKVNKDTVGALTQTADGSIPSIDTNGVSTQVLVDNGETVVLGGVYEQTKTKAVSKVPVLGDIPIIGRVFRRDTNRVTKTELLIFVTPKIIDKRFISRDKFSTLRK